jgi:hypothetical protein
VEWQSFEICLCEYLVWARCSFCGRELSINRRNVYGWQLFTLVSVGLKAQRRQNEGFEILFCDYLQWTRHNFDACGNTFDACESMSKGRRKRKKRVIRCAKRSTATKEVKKTEIYNLIYGTPANSHSARIVRPRKKTKPTKRAIIHEWDNWAALHPDDLKSHSAGMLFFSHLQEKKPELLNLRSPRDKWETVHGWLLQEGRVKD